jgi:hypothetical protein
MFNREPGRFLQGGRNAVLFKTMLCTADRIENCEIPLEAQHLVLGCTGWLVEYDDGQHAIVPDTYFRQAFAPVDERALALVKQ